MSLIAVSRIRRRTALPGERSFSSCSRPVLAGLLILRGKSMLPPGLASKHLLWAAILSISQFDVNVFFALFVVATLFERTHQKNTIIQRPGAKQTSYQAGGTGSRQKKATVETPS